MTNRAATREDWNLLGAHVRATRIEKGLRQRDLAVKIETAVTTVSAWERGVALPTVTQLPVLARALGMKQKALAEMYRITQAARSNHHGPRPRAPRTRAAAARTTTTKRRP